MASMTDKLEEIREGYEAHRGANPWLDEKFDYLLRIAKAAERVARASRDELREAQADLYAVLADVAPSGKEEG